MRPFPVASRPTQFTTIFPHDAHQDIVASKDTANDVATGHFVMASLSVMLDDKKPEFYNCAICHETAKVAPQFAARKPVSTQKPPPAAADNFRPTADFFKDVPGNHASCFNCHYQRIQPISNNCAGCHKLAGKPYFESPVVERYSLKFSHEQVEKDKPEKKAHDQECVTCHVRTAGSFDLQTLKNKVEPEVPYFTCAECHKTNLNKEVEERKNNKAYQCNYCHTSALGRYDKPDSHHEY